MDGQSGETSVGYTLVLSATTGTNLAVTNVAGTVLAAWTAAQLEITLTQTNTTTITGTISNGVLTFTALTIVVDPLTGVVTFNQYLPFEHVDGANNHDDTDTLLLDAGTLAIVQEVTATDGDTDFDTDTASVTLASTTGSMFAVEDDGIEVDASAFGAALGTLTLDESILDALIVPADANANADNTGAAPFAGANPSGLIINTTATAAGLSTGCSTPRR